MFKFITTPLAIVVLVTPAIAQSTATPVVTGYLSASGCPGNQNPCFIQYGVAGGSGSTTASQGAPNAGTTNSWWVQIYNSIVGVKGGDGAAIASSSNPFPVVGYFDSSTKVKGASGSSTTASTLLLAAVSSKILYVMNLDCTNNGSTASLVAFQDGSGGTTLKSVLVPAGGGFIQAASYPIIWTTSGNGLYFAPGQASSTVSCNASGFSGT